MISNTIGQMYLPAFVTLVNMWGVETEDLGIHIKN